MRSFDSYKLFNNKEVSSIVVAGTAFTTDGTPYTLYEPRLRDYKEGNLATAIGAGGRKGLPRRQMDPSIGLKMAVAVYVTGFNASSSNVTTALADADSSLLFNLVNGSNTTLTGANHTITTPAVTPTATVDAVIRKVVTSRTFTPSTDTSLSDLRVLGEYFVMPIPEGSLGERYLDLEIRLRTDSANHLKYTFDAYYAPWDSFQVDTGDRPIPKQVIVK